MPCRILALVLTVIAISAVPAESRPADANRNAAKPDAKAIEIRIQGAGSTTVGRLLLAWADAYRRIRPGIRISYQAIGSHGGIRQLISRTAFFAATDMPMSSDQLAASDGRILNFPVTLNAIVPIYNLAELPGLRFSGATLADIFLGKITKWDDPAIANDNPGARLPRMDIKVIHYFPNRSVETDILADYLSKASPTFKATLAASGDWPLAGVRYKGAEGAAAFVPETPGSIGYLPLEIATLRGLEYAAVKNSDGEFVAPSAESVTAAAAAELPSIQTSAPDFRISITNAPGKNSYPIASFIWLAFYQDPGDTKQRDAMVDFLKWILTDGQKLALKVGYPALPNNLIDIELQQLSHHSTQQ